MEAYSEVKKQLHAFSTMIMSKKSSQVHDLPVRKK